MASRVPPTRRHLCRSQSASVRWPAASNPPIPVNVTCANHWEIVFAVLTDNADSYLNFSKQMDMVIETEGDGGSHFQMSTSCTSDNTALFLSPEKIRQETVDLCQTAKVLYPSLLLFPLFQFKKGYFAGQSEKYPFDTSFDSVVTNDTLLQLLNKIVGSSLMLK